MYGILTGKLQVVRMRNPLTLAAKDGEDFPLGSQLPVGHGGLCGSLSPA